MARSKGHRRDFLKTSAATAAALSLSAATYNRVYGANERIGVGFIGVGGRCQAHLDIINKFKAADKGVEPVAVCDVWDGNKEVGRGLYPSAEKVGLKVDDKKHVTKNYEDLLGLKEVDIVCIAAPDHWHAKLTIDAAKAKKHVYCEKPMTKTIDEAHAVVDAIKENGVVMQVGVQSMADPTWLKANELIREGRIGHVAQAQTSYYRNSSVGQWRYYKLTRDMNPTTVDWDRFLGHGYEVMKGVPLGPKMPFDRAVYGQWRCYWPFGGGMFTDLFVHQTTHTISAMGVRYPARVTAGGGLYLEYDGRDVPDVSTIVADYAEGCQLMITATMINDHPIEECIRGHLGTIRFVNRDKELDGKPVVDDKGKVVKEFGLEILPQSLKAGPGVPKRLENMKGEFIPGGLKGVDTVALWENFLDCVRTKKHETLSTPELGAAAFTTVAMGVQSYRTGQVLYWDKDKRQPVQADSTWAKRWEERSKKHGECEQIIGWKGGKDGSQLDPPKYQELAGAWVDGKDPAPESTSSKQ